MPWEYFDRSATEVETNISIMNQRADEAMAAALEAVESLKGINFDTITGSVPQQTLPDIAIPDAVTPEKPGDRNFGDISSGQTIWEDLTSAFGIDTFNDTVEPFVYSGPMPETVTPPGAFTETLHAHTVGSITIPGAQTFTLPDIGNMIDITIPEFEFPEMPEFDSEAPSFVESPPNSSLSWSPSQYVSASLTEVQDEIHRMMQGGTGIPVAIQDALFQAARSREDVTALAAQQEAFDTFAGRGFAMPPGMLAKAVEAATEKSRLAANALERDILTKAATWEIENLRFAVEKGIALQTVFIGLFEKMAELSFEAAKERLAADIKLFDSSVTLFNAKQNAYAVAATVFKARIEAAIQSVQMYKTRVEAEAVKGTVNEQTAKVFATRVEAVGKMIENYKVTMQVAEVQAKIEEVKVQAYKGEVEAYAQKVAAKKAEYDGYDSRIKAELSKAQIFDAHSRAYAAKVGAFEAKAGAFSKVIDARAAAIQASNDKFRALSEEQRNLTQAQLASVEARASAFNAEVGRYTAEIQGSNQTRGVELQVAEARLRNLLAYYEIQVREYDQQQERLLKRVTILEEALKAAGQVSGALATGAMSAIHVAANMHGNATVSDNQNYSVNISRQGADAA